MAEYSYDMDQRIIFASLLIIAALSIIDGLSAGQTLNILTMFFVLAIVIANIGYIYSKSKAKKQKSTNQNTSSSPPKET